MDNIETTPNKYMAILWFVLSVLAAIAAVAVLWTPVKLLIVGLLMLSAILLLMGFQRTENLHFETNRFKRILWILGFSTAVISCFAAPISIAIF